MVKILSDIQFSGSMGNLTYSHNKGGQYIRARRIPTNPNSSRQQATRSVLGTYASAWSGLSAANRASWNSYAATHTVKDALGQDVYISGINWFIKCNSILLDAGQTPVTTPPAGVAPASLAGFAVTFTDADTISVAFSTVFAAGEFLQIWQTMPSTVGRSQNFNQARLVGYTTDDPTTPVSIDLPYPPASGQQVRFFCAVCSAEGLLSAKVVDTETYTA